MAKRSPANSALVACVSKAGLTASPAFCYHSFMTSWSRMRKRKKHLFDVVLYWPQKSAYPQKEGNMENRQSHLFGNAAFVFFLLTQVGDGALTYLGVSVYASHREGNPAMIWIMNNCGYGLGIIAAKSITSGLGMSLHLIEAHRLIFLLAMFYLWVAIVPWCHALFW